MFIVGMMSVFIGISLLAPDEAKGIVVGHDILGCVSKLRMKIEINLDLFRRRSQG